MDHGYVRFPSQFETQWLRSSCSFWRSNSAALDRKCFSDALDMSVIVELCFLSYRTIKNHNSSLFTSLPISKSIYSLTQETIPDIILGKNARSCVGHPVKQTEHTITTNAKHLTQVYMHMKTYICMYVYIYVTVINVNICNHICPYKKLRIQM